MSQLQTLRGMADQLPTGINSWQQLEAIAREHMRRACVSDCLGFINGFGFKRAQIRTQLPR